MSSGLFDDAQPASETRRGQAEAVQRGDTTDGVEMRWARFVGQGEVGRPPMRKRVFDFAVSLVLALVTAPVVLVLAVGSGISFRAWPFFAHSRVGRSGELFRFLKVRSMPMHAPRYADKYEIRTVEIGPWGGLLRRSHLDELPQLWLVLAGKMSLVGPRPEMPELLMTFDRRFVEERLTVPQGCTGLWQVSAGSAGLIGEGPEWDLFYIRNWTLRLDVWILWRTLLSTVGRNITSIESVPRWCIDAALRG